MSDLGSDATYPRRMVAGVRPAGRLHLGNYFGSIHDALTFQYEYVGGAFYFIADLHELTSVPLGGVLREKTLMAAIEYLALGLEPDMVTFYLQSDVPQVSELMWIVSCVTPSGWLESAPRRPNRDDRALVDSAGAYLYPALMAADCLALRVTDVPIGSDQAHNAELVQGIARRWNEQFSTELLPLPRPRLSLHPCLPGLNGARMSKRADNSIPVFAEEAELQARAAAIRGPAAPRVLDQLLEALTGASPNISAVDHQERAIEYGRRCLVQEVLQRFADARRRRRDWAQRPEDVEDLLLEGGERARIEATETLELVRSAVGIGIPTPWT